MEQFEGGQLVEPEDDHLENFEGANDQYNDPSGFGSQQRVVKKLSVGKQQQAPGGG